MWKETTQFRYDARRFFLPLLLRAGVVVVVFLNGIAWAKWPTEPSLEAAYVDWENLSIGVSGKAPPHFLLSSVSQSRSSSERLARLNAAERLFLLIRELRLSRTLKLGECAPESQLKEALASLFLSQTPAAHWRFSDGGQSFFFKLPLSSLAPLCPELTKAISRLPSLPAEEIFAKQGEMKALWVVHPQEVPPEPCLFPVLFSENRKWFLDTADAGYVVVWSAKAPASIPKPTLSKATPSKRDISGHGALLQGFAAWVVQAMQRDSCGFELSNEVAAELNSKIHAKQLGQRIVVKIQEGAK
jgi:hypothetical protein